MKVLLRVCITPSLQYDRAIFSLKQQKGQQKERLIDSRVWKQPNVTSHKDLAGITPNGPKFLFSTSANTRV